MMDRTTGRPLSRQEHIAQSITDILTTPVGTRVLAREYGAALADQVDAPGNEVGRLRLMAVSADAIARWEDRVDLRACMVTLSSDGKAILSYDLVDRATGLPMIVAVTR